MSELEKLRGAIYKNQIGYALRIVKRDTTGVAQRYLDDHLTVYLQYDGGHSEYLGTELSGFVKYYSMRFNLTAVATIRLRLLWSDAEVTYELWISAERKWALQMAADWLVLDTKYTRRNSYGASRAWWAAMWYGNIDNNDNWTIKPETDYV